jgi:hypothetical protein
MNKHRADLSYKKKWAWWRNNNGVLIMWNTEALDAVWLKHGALATKAKDREGYKSLKKACKDRKDVLGGKA